MSKETTQSGKIRSAAPGGCKRVQRRIIYILPSWVYAAPCVCNYALLDDLIGDDAEAIAKPVGALLAKPAPHESLICNSPIAVIYI